MEDDNVEDDNVEDDNVEDADDFEYVPEFLADECTCEHDPDEHGWGFNCKVIGCDCTAGWVD